MSLISTDELKNLIQSNPNFKNGCILDTNILISAILSIDPMNEDAEEFIQVLKNLEIPAYTNVNIRAEFLEIQRRVLMAECLIEFYESHIEIDELLSQKLKSIQTSYRKAIELKKVYKLTDDRIKEFRNLFSELIIQNKNGWLYFCETFLTPQLSVVWSYAVELCC